MSASASGRATERAKRVRTGITIAQISPRVQARKVLQGMSKSSAQKLARISRLHRGTQTCISHGGSHLWVRTLIIECNDVFFVQVGVIELRAG